MLTTTAFSGMNISGDRLDVPESLHQASGGDDRGQSTTTHERADGYRMQTPREMLFGLSTTSSIALAVMVYLASAQSGPGIVYAPSRDKTERLAEAKDLIEKAF